MKNNTTLLGRIAGWQNTSKATESALWHRWSKEEVARHMAALCPPPSAQPGDQSVLRQQLTSAFLAGVAESQDELLLQPRGTLAEAAARQALVLLKNRAATQADRQRHAFLAGERAARWPTSSATSTPRTEGLKLFVRQPFTESGEAEQALIASVLERIADHDGNPHSFHYLTGRKAENAQTFRASFKAECGHDFTPQRFRQHRLDLLSQADAFVNIRVGMSESSAFELAYHVFRGACTPVLFLVWKHAPIKTTLLKDLDHLCDVTYLEFEEADDLRDGIGDFFQRCKSA
jgi:carbamoyl-phosphate synthase large subunit